MNISLDQARAHRCRRSARRPRERFVLPEGVIYLDGNSLGALPRAAAARQREVIEREWGERLIRSWNEAGWIEAPQRVGAKIARLVGAKPHEVIVADSTSVNLFKLLAAAAKLSDRPSLLTEAGNFHTDLHIASGVAETDRPAARPRATRAARSRRGLVRTPTILLLTHVHYKPPNGSTWLR